MNLYLDLIKKCVMNTIYAEQEALERITLGNITYRTAHTMIGRARLDNVQMCVEDVISKNIPGDLVETGVWNGGSTILMRAILKSHGIIDRKVWVADSFQGCPVPTYTQDEGLNLYKRADFAVSLEKVKDNFSRYGLLDNQVEFLEGWFKDTLPVAPISQIAVLRLDGDLYESTIDGLRWLYPKLAPGGYVIIDDYNCYKPCKEAVAHYRQCNNITTDIQTVDWTGAYWRKDGG